MRLFAALPLPGAVAASLQEAVSGLRASGWPVRWVARDDWHVTLAFFGEVDTTRAASLDAVLDDAVRATAPVTLEPVAVRPVPGGARARMLWLELGSEPAVELLAHRIARGASAVGVGTEGAAFRPHVTLGRVVRGARLPAEVMTCLSSLEPPPAFLVDEVRLFESHLGAGPPRYEVRHVARLVA
jgi:2'-5' RNA ligase